MRPVRVVFADGGAGRRAEVLRLAERAAFEVVGEAVDWPEIVDLVQARAADAVLIAGDPSFASGVKILDGGVASVILAETAGDAPTYSECAASAVLSIDGDPDLLRATVQIAIANARQLSDVRAEAERLRDQLDTRKVVERAKGVLMTKLGLSEDEAYRRMQRASQEENRKMRDIAESILSAERLYGGTGSAR